MQQANAAAAETQALTWLADLSLREKVGQLFMSHVHGHTSMHVPPWAAQRNLADFGVQDARELISTYHLGGVIYYKWAVNLVNPHQIARLSNDIQRETPTELFIAIDQENGRVDRLGTAFTQFPGALALGATEDPQHAHAVGRVVGKELKRVGINQIYAPVCDVLADSNNAVIGTRSFGSDPARVGAFAAANTLGLQQYVSAVAKHFPGHGATDIDSHTSLPTIQRDHDWSRWDLPPFLDAIRVGVDAIMTAHISVPALDPRGRPATLSRRILTDILRSELNYSGLIITDALDMGAIDSADQSHVVEAFQAGADLLMRPSNLPNAYDAVLRAVESGEIGEDRLHESVLRILRVKARRRILGGAPVDLAGISEAVAVPEHTTIARTIGHASVTLIKDDAGLLPLHAGRYTRVRVIATCDSPAFLVAKRLADKLASAGHPSAPTDLHHLPSLDDVKRLTRNVEPTDLIIAMTERAWIGERFGQRELVSALAGLNVPIIHVSLAEPFDITHLSPDLGTALCAYSASLPSVDALADILTGHHSPRGTLPVSMTNDSS
ncbi:glycoside hydrolase family 3 protein [Nonomuraea angiospora]|uniref:beta-N-acetylhexosaminidase n=1 Tax=Nonomuraea angiospora TaxID=46172 RepID=A0ABR9LPC7_9ACTN|nr:glycoside hydrolase family 3 protein [Nonomuraea angiospora]MBE1582285.1 beta-N-acetylhexosaminidase [Nonomuraea angiospora]